jgi:hypothetical protein
VGSSRTRSVSHLIPLGFEGSPGLEVLTCSYPFDGSATTAIYVFGIG